MAAKIAQQDPVTGKQRSVSTATRAAWSNNHEDYELLETIGKYYLNIFLSEGTLVMFFSTE